MSKILIFAGTTEGRKLSEYLSAHKTLHTICVATDYGCQVIEPNDYANVRNGRLNRDEMADLFSHEDAEVVVDATHPYAEAVTENIKAAAATAEIHYLRLLRDTEIGNSDICRFFDSIESCISALQNTSGNILLTTGSKDLRTFCVNSGLLDRIIARVLPGSESIALCEQAGLKGKSIIAMQGPFSTEMNMALIREYDAKVMVTKASGNVGGFDEKVKACEALKIPLFVIGHPVEKNGLDFNEICLELKPYMEQGTTITLIGCGMGQIGSLTEEAARAIASAEVIFGSKRLISTLGENKQSYPLYQAEDIIPILKQNPGNAVVLFSGDTGFYSGCKKAYKSFLEEFQKGELQGEVRILPGISSLSMLCSAFGISWEDARIISIHGNGSVAQNRAEILNAVLYNRKTFMLLSGVSDVNNLASLFLDMDFNGLEIYIGYNMACPNEAYMRLSLKECLNLNKDGLYSLLVHNPFPKERVLMKSIPDECFIRGRVPMTKEEIRTVSLSKLELTTNSVLLDIGSGTGSVAVNAAILYPLIKVYAIERHEEACGLIRANSDLFHCSNLTLIQGTAPQCISIAEKPTHAFIGGSGGNLKDIIDKLLQMNAGIRIVINAVSLETIHELVEIEKMFPVEDFEIVSLSASKIRKLGDYHMNTAENPVWICSFKGKDNE